MRAQTETALADCDAILFVIDARAGVTGTDRHFAAAVRRAGKPIIVIANKAESGAGRDGAYDAFSLGLGDPIVFSAEHGEGMGELYDALAEALPPAARLDPDEEDEGERAGARRGGGRQRTRRGQAPAHRRARPAQRRQVDAARTASSARTGC